ncbi:MAG: aminotransferase class V-fold PLP-dependent enzyme [Arenicellales bacterium]|nr:aminotransferase class V-fold PLP-dependent enzyme [Arenicellales bacterium]
MSPTPPKLEAAFEITNPLDCDIDAIIAPILAKSSESPIVNFVPANTLDGKLATDVPGKAVPLEDILQEMETVVVSHARRNAHPGFYGYIAGPGLPTDPMAHAFVGALNQNVIGYPGAPGATVVEQTVIGWFRQLAGLPDSSEGAIVSGGSVANLSALAVALYSAIGREYIQAGLASYTEAKPVIVGARTTHFCIQRAALMLGLGAGQVVVVEHDENFRMRPDSLEKTLLSCRDQGLKPVCVVASAGTTVTGSIDPLDALADICENNGIWFHVDAAYGGAGLWSPELRPRFTGIERADSVCMDLHKWFYLAFDGSVLLFRQPELARHVYYTRSDYVQFPKQGTPEEYMFFHFSPELSRRFRGLPAYIAFRYYGGEILGRNIYHNHECAAYLAELVEQDADLELICKPDLSICCFRYNPSHLRDQPGIVDRLNRKIRQRLQEGGDFLLSPTDVENRPVLRVCIVSYTTRAQHMERLVHRVKAIGEELSKL